MNDSQIKTFGSFCYWCDAYKNEPTNQNYNGLYSMNQSMLLNARSNYDLRLIEEKLESIGLQLYNNQEFNFEPSEEDESENIEFDELSNIDEEYDSNQDLT